MLTDGARNALLTATDTDTLTTRVFDIAAGYRGAHQPERVLRNSFVDRRDGHEDELQQDPPRSQISRRQPRPEIFRWHRSMPARVSLRSRPYWTAAELIEQLCTGAESLPHRRWDQWLGMTFHASWLMNNATPMSSSAVIHRPWVFAIRRRRLCPAGGPGLIT